MRVDGGETDGYAGNSETACDSRVLPPGECKPRLLLAAFATRVLVTLRRPLLLLCTVDFH
jgi:hypothetical protein